MANAFSREERVAFLEMCKGFEDDLVLSLRTSKYNTDQTMMERAGDTIWRSSPYIANSYSGLDQSSNFTDIAQLSVPATIGHSKSVPWKMSAKELRDMLQTNRFGIAARQKLASDVNSQITNTAAYQGTVFIKRSSAASGFDDVAAIDSACARNGIPTDGQVSSVYSAADYNNMASNLATRDNLTAGITSEAFRRAYVGEVASIETFKTGTALRLTAAAGTGVTVNGANQYHVPVATSTAATGETSNVDNRTQNLAITVTSGTVKVGDAFTIAGVYEVHQITKEATAELKTFRITAIVSGAGGTGTVTISPAIISNGGSTRPEIQYQNVSATPANGAAITFLNTADAYMNPWFHYDAIELLPGRYEVEENAGMHVLRATLDNGMMVMMSKQAEIGGLDSKYRVDTFFGTVCKAPEMAGVTMFSQT